MIIGKVTGSAVAILKHDALRSTKLLLVSPADTHGEVCGSPFIAVDLVGAGEGELVMVSQGSSARLATGQNASPVDAAIVGILDSLAYEGDYSFRKGMN
jgi:ethanolamine utilization protein EutN